MPTITLNRNAVENLIGKKLSDEKLKERISMLGTDLESIGKENINVEIFPNRPDLLSEQGFARALSSFVGVKTGLRKYEVFKSGEKLLVDKTVDGIRPYTACAIVKDLKFDNEKIKEVIQIQEKLHVTYGRNRKRCAIGIYPMEKIKFPVKYKALHPNGIKFRPLEAVRHMDGLEILRQHKTGMEYAYLLDGLPRFPVFTDANNNILSMPPIINSHETGKITETTTDVFIETSGFYYDVCAKCLNMIVTALADMGGKIYSMDLVYPTKKYVSPDLTPKKMKVKIDYINRLLGLKLKNNDVKKLLEKMGYGYEKGNALIPAYRADILHQADLAEDIAIAYGYENFDEIIPKVATIAEESEFELFKKKISYLLAGLGLLETKSYNLIDCNIQTKMMNMEMDVLSILDPVSLEYNSLRSWMTPSLLHILKENKHHEYPQKIFEIGRVFWEDKTNEYKNETGTAEAERLCVALCDMNADFTQIKQVFDYLMRMLDLKYETSEADHPSFIPGRTARISVNGQKVCYIGEIDPKVLENFGLEMPVGVFELNLCELWKVIRE